MLSFRTVFAVFGLVGFLSVSAHQLEAAVVPVDNGLVVWLKADAITGKADGATFAAGESWLDSTVSGSGIGDDTSHDAGLSDGGPTYQTNMLNGLPAVEFGGADAFQYSGAIGISGAQAPLTAIIVGARKSGDADGDKRVFHVGAGPDKQGVGFDIASSGFRFNGGNRIFSDSGEIFPSDATFHVGTWTMNSSSTYGGATGGAYYLDGTAGTQNSSANPTKKTNINDVGYTVGRGITATGGDGNYMSGFVAEVLLFDRELTAAELGRVSYYLEDKYALASSFAAPTQVFFDDLDATDNDWQRGGNWDTSVVPTDTQDVYIGGNLTSTLTTAAVGQNVFVGHNETTLPNAGTLTINTGGTLDTANLNVGNGGKLGTVNQNDGTVTLTGNLNFGATGNQGGTYNLTGGTLNVAGEIKERIAGVNSAQFHLDGGTLNVTGDITTQRFALGQAAGTTGIYTIDTGKTLTTTGTLAVGANGTGHLTLDGGTIDVANSVIGETATGNGTLIIDSGTAKVKDLLTVGGKGTATLNLNDGTLTVTDGIYLASNATANATMTIGTADGSTSPTLTVSGANFEAGRGGTADVTMYSGTFYQNSNNIIVGQSAGSDGTFTLEGGLIDINDQLRVGNSGTGLFVQNAGTVNVGTQLDLGNGTGGDGTYTMYGGTLNVGDRVKNNLVIGNFNNTTTKAQFNLIDGTVTVSDGIRIADTGANSSGTLVIGDGTTNPTMTIGGQFESADNGDGVFTFNSGTLTETAGNFITGQNTDTVSTVTIGGGTTDAVFNLDGGDGDRDWNTNGGNGIISVLDGGTVNVGRNMNLGNNTNANSGMELTIEGGTVNVGTQQAAGGIIDYRNDGPKDQITLDDGILDLNGGEILFADAMSSQFEFNGGRLADVGSFGSTLTQDGGTLAPGDELPGMTVITGDYDFNAGSLEIQINGLDQGDQASDDDIGYDFVDVTGDATIDGIVDPYLIDGFVPVVGQTFDVLTASSVILGSSFDIGQLSGYSGGWVARIITGGNGQILQLMAVPEPSTIVLAAFAFLGLLALARRRKARIG